MLEVTWKLPDWKPKERESHGNSATAETMKSAPFTKDQLDLIQKLFGKTNSANLVSAETMDRIASGADSLALHISQSSSSSWIVDSRASDHMTSDRKLFTNVTHNRFV